MKAGNAAGRLWTQQKQVIQKKVGECNFEVKAETQSEKGFL